LTNINNEHKEEINNRDIKLEIKTLDETIETNEVLKKNYSKKTNLSDLRLIGILNHFMFYLFVMSILIHNLMCLFLFPNFVRIPLVIDD
jgi:hypothetical protein